MNSIYLNTYNALIEINQDINRAVINKELKTRKKLLQEGLFSRAPSKEMQNAALKFISNIKKSDSDNFWYNLIDGYAHTVGGNNLTTPDELDILRKFADTKNVQYSSSDITMKQDGIPILYKTDIPKITELINTVLYLSKTNASVKNFVDKNKLAYYNGEVLYKALNRLTNSSAVVVNGSDILITLQKPMDRGHEISHFLTRDEIKADYLGVISNNKLYDGSKTISSDRAIKMVSSQIYNRLWNFIARTKAIKFHKDALKNILEVLDLDVKYAQLRLKLLKSGAPVDNDTENSLLFKLRCAVFLKDKLKDVKPLKYIHGMPIYDEEVNKILYRYFKLKDPKTGEVFEKNGLINEHPPAIVRANYVLHLLFPKRFDQYGKDLVTGKQVDLSLRGQIIRALDRAKTVGKRHFKLAVGKLIRSFGRTLSKVKSKVSSVFMPKSVKQPVKDKQTATSKPKIKSRASTVLAQRVKKRRNKKLKPRTVLNT